MNITLSVIKADIGSIGGHTLGTGTSWFDGPPLVTAAAFSMHGGRLTEPSDAFAHPFCESVRDRVANKGMEMRRQGFVGAAMLPMAELEYTGITEKLAALDKRFVVRAPTTAKAEAAIA
jgi:fructose 1,6-bisphosphate aldolase/phosphatase